MILHDSHNMKGEGSSYFPRVMDGTEHEIDMGLIERMIHKDEKKNGTGGSRAFSRGSSPKSTQRSNGTRLNKSASAVSLGNSRNNDALRGSAWGGVNVDSDYTANSKKFVCQKCKSRDEDDLSEDEMSDGLIDPIKRVTRSIKDSFLSNIDHARSKSQMVFITKNASRDAISRLHCMEALEQCESQARAREATLTAELKACQREVMDSRTRLVAQKEEFENALAEKDEVIASLRASVKMLQRKVHQREEQITQVEAENHTLASVKPLLQSIASQLDLTSPEAVVSRVKSLEAEQLSLIKRLSEAEDDRRLAERAKQQAETDCMDQVRKVESKLSQAQAQIERLSRKADSNLEASHSELAALQDIKERHLTLCRYIEGMFVFWTKHTNWGKIQQHPALLLQEIKWRLKVRFGSLKEAWLRMGLPRYTRVTRQQFQVLMARLNLQPFEASRLFDFFLRGGGPLKSPAGPHEPPPVELLNAPLAAITAADEDKMIAEAQEAELREMVAAMEQRRREANGQGGGRISRTAVLNAIKKNDADALVQVSGDVDASNSQAATIQMLHVYQCLEQGLEYGPLYLLRDKPEAPPLEKQMADLAPDKTEPLWTLKAVHQLMVLADPGRGAAQLHEITQLCNALYRTHFAVLSQSGHAADATPPPGTGGPSETAVNTFEPTAILKALGEVLQRRADSSGRLERINRELSTRVQTLSQQLTTANRETALLTSKNEVAAARLATVTGLPRQTVASVLLDETSPSDGRRALEGLVETIRRKDEVGMSGALPSTTGSLMLDDQVRQRTMLASPSSRSLKASAEGKTAMHTTGMTPHVRASSQFGSPQFNPERSPSFNLSSGASTPSLRPSTPSLARPASGTTLRGAMSPTLSRPASAANFFNKDQTPSRPASSGRPRSASIMNGARMKVSRSVANAIFQE